MRCVVCCLLWLCLDRVDGMNWTVTATDLTRTHAPSKTALDDMEEDDEEEEPSPPKSGKRRPASSGGSNRQHHHGRKAGAAAGAITARLGRGVTAV